MIISGTLWACALMSTKGYTPPNLHKVGKNETFASISRRYNTGYERLMTANPTIVPEKLKPGAVIVIPGRVKTTEAKSKAGTYSVRNGDTDWSIARRYNIKPSELRAMNPGVKWTAIGPGKSINVPTKLPAIARAGATPHMALASAKPKKGVKLGQHKVGQDDNDWIIARGYGITPKQLRLLNPGVNWNKLRPGMKVVVPMKSDNIARITTKRAKVIKDNVLVRAGARTDSPRVTMVEYGRFATVADRIGNWYKLKFSGGTVGWIRGDLLKPVSAHDMALAIKDTTPVRVRERNTETLVARRSSSTSSSTRKRLEREVASPVRTRSSSSTKSTSRRNSYADNSNVVALNDSDRDGVIGTAMSRMGTRYRWGGTTPAGFDCSGFTGYVYARNGKRLPRTAAEQSRQGQSVGRDSLKKGDLVFFKTTRSDRVSHVGIYVGDGKFVHASSGGGRVRVNNLSDSYYSKRFAGAKRVNGGSSKSSDTSSSKPKSTKSKDIAEEVSSTESKAPVVEDPKPQTVKGTDAVGR